MAKRKLPTCMYLRGDVYYAAFRSGGRLVRKRLSRNFQTAKRLLNELLSRRDRNAFGILDNDHPWDDLCQRFLDWSQQSRRSCKNHRRDLKKFSEFCEIRSASQVTQAHVLAFRRWRLDQGVRPLTVNAQVSTIRSVLEKGVRWGLLRDNALKDLERLEVGTPGKVRRSLSIEELEAIFAESPEYLRPVWRMFITTGIRRNELQSLRFNDIDFERRCIVIRVENAKGRKSREIPLHESMVDQLAALRDAAPERKPTSKTLPGKLTHEHVFVTTANTPHKHNLLRSFYVICQRAGIEGAEPNGSVDIHSLRCSFTTLTIANGASPRAVQEILGHSTLDLTMKTYARATEGSKRRAVEALGDFYGRG